MLQQLCIICIFQRAPICGKYISNNTDNVDFQWKTITGYEKRIENEMEGENVKIKFIQIRKRNQMISQNYC